MMRKYLCERLHITFRDQHQCVLRRNANLDPCVTCRDGLVAVEETVVRDETGTLVPPAGQVTSSLGGPKRRGNNAAGLSGPKYPLRLGEHRPNGKSGHAPSVTKNKPEDKSMSEKKKCVNHPDRDGAGRTALCPECFGLVLRAKRAAKKGAKPEPKTPAKKPVARLVENARGLTSKAVSATEGGRADHEAHQPPAIRIVGATALDVGAYSAAAAVDPAHRDYYALRIGQIIIGAQIAAATHSKVSGQAPLLPGQTEGERPAAEG